MSDFNSIEEILEFAIKNEEEAAAFYRNLATKTNNRAMQIALEEFAKEEDMHKVKLLKVKEGNLLPGALEKVVDLKISDYLDDVNPESSDMDYGKALVLAMKREKAAFKMYTNLAAQVEDEEMSVFFLELAQEEARHKLKFEIEYDEHYLKEA